MLFHPPSLSLSLSWTREENRLLAIQCQSRFPVNSIGRSLATLSRSSSTFNLEHHRKGREIGEIFPSRFRLNYKSDRDPSESFRVKLMH